MDLRIKDGRPFFYQWDYGQFLELVDIRADYLQFENAKGETALITEVIEKDGKYYAPVPNSLLEEEGEFLVWAFDINQLSLDYDGDPLKVDDEGATVFKKKFKVMWHQKPADRPDTPDQVINLEEILRKAQAAALDARKSAGNASTSERNAQISAGLAETAQTAAEDAQGFAETAQGIAETKATEASTSATTAKDEADRAQRYAEALKDGIYTEREEDKLYIHGQGATQSKPVELKVGVEEGKNEASIGYIRTMGINLLTFDPVYFEGNPEQRTQSARWNYICVEPKETYTLHFNEPMAIIRVEGRRTDDTRYTLHEANFTDTLTFTASSRKTVDIYIQSNTFFTPNAIEAQMEFGPRFTEYHAPRGAMYRLNAPDQIKVKKGDYLHKNSDGFWYNGATKLSDSDQTIMESIEIPRGPFYLWCESHSHHYMQGLVTLEYTRDIGTALDEKADKKDTYTKVEVDAELDEKAVVIETSSTGNPLVIPTMEAPFKGLVLHGKTEQVQTTGKNLLDLAMLDYNPSYWKVEGNVVSALQNPMQGEQCNVPVMLESGKTYTFSMNITAGTVKGIMKLGTSEIRPNRTGVHTVTFKPSETKEYPAGFGDWANGNGYVFTDLQVEEGSSATSYEPYTGGKPSPSPEYPQEIKSAGADGTLETRVDGKNLLDYELWKSSVTVGRADYTWENNGITITATGKDAYTSYPTSWGILVAKGQMITISWDIEKTDSTIGLVYLFTNNKPRRSVHSGDRKLTWVSDVNGLFNFRVGVSNAGETIHYKNIQIEFGSEPTSYVPFAPLQTLTSATPNGLNGMNGVDDEKDYGTAKDTKRFEKWVLDGSVDEVWRASSIAVSGTKRYELPLANLKTPSSSLILGNLRCSSYSYILQNDQYQTGTTSICLVSNSNKIAITDTRFPNNIEAFKASLATNPITVIAELAEPIVTDIPQDEMDAYHALRTNKGGTTIWNSAGPIEATYSADTKGYSDMKDEELADEIRPLAEQLATFIGKADTGSAENSYTVLPNGVLLQWGYKRTVESAWQTITLKRPFKNKDFSFLASVVSESVEGQTYTGTSITLGSTGTTNRITYGTNAPTSIRWIAVGEDAEV